MAPRGRRSKRNSGIEATGLAALLVVGAVVWLVQTPWPLLVVVAVGLLIAYAVRRSAARAAAQVEASSDVAAQRSIEPAVDPDSVWVRPGQSVAIGGYTIPGGMVYVGQRLAAIHEWRRPEPALINPRLPIDTARPNRSGDGVPYWPSYSDISPASRAAYLEWLASGRTNREVAIGYVFLFLYGLERRILADAQQSTAVRNEHQQILAEVERLLGLYGEQRSFRGYAGSLLDVMRAQQSDRRLYDAPPPVARSGYELPLTLRVALAQLATDGKPIPGEWAWSWLVCSPETTLRTPAQRCPDEFRALFLARYAQQFGFAGMTLKPSKTRLRIAYRPASASFDGAVDVPVADLSDIAALSTPARRLQEIADTCVEDLTPYSRWLGRNPDGRDSLQAAALLPPELLDGAAYAAVQPLRDWLDAKLGSVPSVLVPAAELLRFWPQTSSAKLAKSDAVSVAQLLARLGCGVEPDVRFGGPPLGSEDPAVIFRLPEESPIAASPAYATATLLLHVGAAVATADGDVTAEEESQLEGQLESTLHLTTAERTRLRAHLAWLLAAQPGMAGLKKRVETLDQTQRRAVGRYLVAVAGADGHFDPAEVTALTKMYRLLGFTATEAYGDVHALASSATPPAAEPVTVQHGDAARTGFAIPPPPDASEGRPAPAVKLDMARVEATLAETKAVAALLTDIFTDEEAAAPEPAPPSASGDRAVAGLDSAHSALVHALAARERWTRAELEALAAAHGLLPDGALDTLNEAALDRCGEPLCDGDDPLTMNASIAQELLA